MGFLISPLTLEFLNDVIKLVREIHKEILKRQISL